MGSAIGKAVGAGEWFFPEVPPSYDDSHERLVRFRTESGGEAPAMLIAPDGGASRGSAVVCVIYFHPNACDIGDSVPEMEVIRDGAFNGDAAVLAPEYPGYGLLSNFQPTPKAIDHIAEGAWRFCRSSLGFQPEQIILWGRSIGTGPASALASRLARRQQSSKGSAPGSGGGRPPLGSLVLVAPFISISAAVSSHAGSLAGACVDAMWNVAELVQTRELAGVPLCIIHPDEDEIIPRDHGERILQGAAARHKLGVWLRGEGHNFSCDFCHLEPVDEFLALRCTAYRLSLELQQEAQVVSTSPREKASGIDALRGEEQQRRQRLSSQELASQLEKWGRDLKARSLI